MAVGGQALAPDIADDQPGAGGGAGGREQITAHLGLLLGRQIQGGDLQETAARGERPEQDLLGDPATERLRVRRRLLRSRTTVKSTTSAETTTSEAIWASRFSVKQHCARCR